MLTVMYDVMRAKQTIAKVNIRFDPCGLFPMAIKKHMTSKPR